jgi:hypothetical protein
MLEEDIKWRIDMKLEELVQMQPSEVVGVDMSIIRRYFPCWTQGTDKFGRPVLYQSYGGNFEIWKLTERGVTVENLLRYHIYENEKYIRLLGQQPEGKRASQVCIIVEAKGWRIGLATRDAMRYLKGITEIDSAHYPERLGINLVLNAPLMLTGTWKIIRSWLDPVSVKKIQILGGESEWRPILNDLIDIDQLAPEYGGRNPTRNADHYARTPSSMNFTSLSTPTSPAWSGGGGVDPEVALATDVEMNKFDTTCSTQDRIYQF